MLFDEALPGGAQESGASAAEALTRAAAHKLLGRRVSIVGIDVRGRRPADSDQILREASRSEPDAELVVFVDSRSGQIACELTRIAPAPDKLTLLACPFDTELCVQTIRRLSARAGAMMIARQAQTTRDIARERLEIEVYELQARLEIARRAARHDDLTGVLNRKGFVEGLTRRLVAGQQDQCVMMIDLDRFKAVNDTLGHAAGDELVRKICAGISSVLDGKGVIARLGGDEFAILIEGKALQQTDQLVQRILTTCAATRSICGQEVQVSTSMGISRPMKNAKPAELMRQADLAMYAAKREGRNRCRRFDEALDRITQYRASIETGLERALRMGEFRMAYQPIVAARSGRILGFEALIRWDSPEHGSISPAEFIPIAEESGLILEIGDWIARHALKDCRRWGGPYVSINLSARQFLRHNVGERILRYASEAALEPARLQIELTETAIIDDVDRANRNLQILRNAGVRVALDDFGTGYSSLVYLKQFAIDCIKIDKSFVDTVATDRQSAMIIASVARLATSLGMNIVAEGVESADQREVLIAAGCDMLQGYLFHKPMDALTAFKLAQEQAAIPA
ncbi:MAG: putative bifunctional diguanylate cyclase/phosphodiesterase [Caulobacteraceae bacterium]